MSTILLCSPKEGSEISNPPTDPALIFGWAVSLSMWLSIYLVKLLEHRET